MNNRDKMKACYETYGRAVTKKMFGYSDFTITDYAKRYNWKRATSEEAAENICKLLIQNNIKF